jgi:DNA-binding response OmpR family regulator
MTNGGGAKILVVEDEPETALLLRDLLTESGYEVVHAPTAAAAEAALRSGDTPPDLIVLDLMLPDMDGLVLCAKIRARHAMPIIVCTATHRRHDPALALRLGADDFVLKPFDIDVFEARIEAALRRAAPAQPAVDGGSLQVGGLTIDHVARTASARGSRVRLTPTEFRLLQALASRPDTALSRQELAQHMWGYRNFDSGRLVDVHVRRLREKLNAISGMGVLIVSIRGEGYKLMASYAQHRDDASA